MKKKIQTKIEDLKKERGNIKEFSAFGDDNWSAIDKGIEVLEELLKQPTKSKLEYLILVLEDEIDDIEDEYGDDSQYEEMSDKRQPLQDTIEILEELK